VALNATRNNPLVSKKPKRDETMWVHQAIDGIATILMEGNQWKRFDDGMAHQSAYDAYFK
jgi:hypothetical protein